MPTTSTLSPEAKAAYNKGWASQAKTEESATASFIKATPVSDAVGTLGWFRAGYTDKQSGAAKWTTDADGDKPEAAEAPESAEGPTAEVTAPAAADPAAEAKASRRGGKPASIAALQAKITKDMPREEVKQIRDLITQRKNHYKMGWNSYLSPLFNKDHGKASAGYAKRHADSKFTQDWEDGWKDNKAGHEYGDVWAVKK
ncbi:hypothetical protein ACFVWT_04100 [Arthrobacter sp. NPDC058288]|uniref:hypothetical protein n=1 Tax=Arthrobacter sp. NPDC058288 TaxID=3346424 RepID=UPI0036E3AC86